MDLQLQGKRALVTGASSGIGEAIARALASEGVDVVVHGRDRLRTSAVVDTIRASGSEASACVGDLSTEEGCKDVSNAARDLGAIDILINNAGIYAPHSWDSATSDAWLETFTINVLSSVRLVKELLPTMRSKGWGRVIQIGGGLGIQPEATFPQYSASLAARHNLAVSLARELKGTGITSNVVSPGAIHVPQVEKQLLALGRLLNWGDTWDKIEPLVVERLVPNDAMRLGTPEEVAAAVVFLCSPRAAYISGTIMRVDGGTVRGVC
jgi:3-oxoacyl-[acyl-carrier protein] reductase